MALQHPGLAGGIAVNRPVPGGQQAAAVVQLRSGNLSVAGQAGFARMKPALGIEQELLRLNRTIGLHLSRIYRQVGARQQHAASGLRQ